VTKTFFAALTLAASLAATASAQDHQQHSTHHAEAGGEKATAAEALRAGGGHIKRGEAIGESPAVAFADVVKEPSKFAGKTVIVEGVVERVCQQQGCWMQITPEAGAADAVRVTFDHKFVIPKDADRLKFRAEGTFALKYLTEDEATHLEKDGARLKRDKDGEATELTFRATGVELWK
jgi:Domain of unknown function (DUF4920)